MASNGDVIVPSHRDYYHPEDPWNEDHDPSRLQATLFLSERDADYSGEGLWIEDNSGLELVFGRDVPIKAGDLVFWRYWNQHGVRNVKVDQDQRGFVRFVYPPVAICDKPSILHTSWRNAILAVKRSLPTGLKQKVKALIRR